MTTPLFSVVVPTRNRLEKAKRAIASVLAQGHRDFELIVSDNSTTGGTELQDWLRGRTDLPARFQYIRTGGGLEMDANWESASLRAGGRYLLVLPDRWVMRGGALGLLASIVARQHPECVFWDSRLSINDEGHFRGHIDNTGPVHCEVRSAHDMLASLLNFDGYATDTVFKQPFPRGLNSITRSDVIERIRARVGVLFAPNACDYTSGVSILLNTTRLTHLHDSLYLGIGTDSNGQRLSVFGVPEPLRPATRWRGLELDTVFLTVMNDVESTLQRHGATAWRERIAVANVLLSLLNEIHFKEWHGSPLDTQAMRERVMDYARQHARELGPAALERLAAYDRAHAPRLRPGRRLLQRLDLFYKLYALKHTMLGHRTVLSGHRYSDDLLSARPIQFANAPGAH
jgi:hypothetical protein